MTYAEVDRASRAVAAWLQQKLGVKRGDRIALMCPNVFAFPIAMLGIHRAGAAQVNVNPLYTPRELAHQLNDAGVETIIIFGGSTPTLAEIVGQTPVKTVITVDLGDGSGLAIPSPAADPRLDGRDPLRRRAGRGRRAPVRAGGAHRRRHPVLPVHRRHHRPLEGRGADAPQPRRQYRAVQGLHARGDRARQGGGDPGAAALPHLRADADARLHVGRRQGHPDPQPARHGGLLQGDQELEVLGDRRRQHPLPGHGRLPRLQGRRPLQLQGRDRRRRGGDQGHLRGVEGDHRQAPEGGLRPLRDLAGALHQPDVDQRVHRDLRPAGALDRDQAPRRRRQRGRPRARRARSAPAARRS